MVKKADIPKAGLAAALKLAATVGWRDASMRDIAEEAGVTLARLHEAYRSKGAILDAFVGQIDATVLAGDSPELAAESTKDRLFDVMMRRFDALRPHREAVGSIVAAAATDPRAALGGACRLVGSMRWMLEAAGVGGAGVAGGLRAKALAAIHADVMRIWLKDDSEDMDRTMAALDKRLSQAETAMERLCGLARSRRGGEGAPAGEASA